MKHIVPKLIGLVLFWSILVLSCKSSDPTPLGAQKNATYLAGAAGKTKTWKLRELTYQDGTSAAQSYTLPGYFADNLYTFSNNAAQNYSATEGTTKYPGSTSDAIESGTWAFTLDGLRLNVEVDNSQSPNGIFSTDFFLTLGDTTNLPHYFTQTPINIIYFGKTPYPAFVQKLDDNNLILEFDYVAGSSTTKYTLTFTP